MRAKEFKHQADAMVSRADGISSFRRKREMNKNNIVCIKPSFVSQSKAQLLSCLRIAKERHHTSYAETSNATDNINTQLKSPGRNRV